MGTDSLWWEIAEAYKREILVSFGRHELPPYLKPEDVYQDVMEFVLRKGWQENVAVEVGTVVPFFRLKGLFLLRDALRAERGESGEGPRTFIQFTDELVSIRGPEDFVGVGKDVREALGVLDTQTALKVWERYALGYTVKEVAAHFGEGVVVTRNKITRARAKLARLLTGYEKDFVKGV